jgi:hypothetical protein
MLATMDRRVYMSAMPKVADAVIDWVGGDGWVGVAPTFEQ